MGIKIGYARVSSTGQSLEVQKELLIKAGCEKMFQETRSGKQGQDRPKLKEALNFIREDDTMVVTRLDRLARSVYDLHRIAQELKDKGAGLIAINQPEIDTTTKYGKLVFTILGGVAELERDLILERTAEGRARAKAAGKHLGRRPTLSPVQIAALKKDAAKWKGSASELGEKYGISRASVYRLRNS